MHPQDMPDLTPEDKQVLDVMETEGRANPYLIREQTDLDKGTVNTVLNRLGRRGYIRQVTRGLYEYQGDPNHDRGDGGPGPDE